MKVLVQGVRLRCHGFNSWVQQVLSCGTQITNLYSDTTQFHMASMTSSIQHTCQKRADLNSKASPASTVGMCNNAAHCLNSSKGSPCHLKLAMHANACRHHI